MVLPEIMVEIQPTIHLVMKTSDHLALINQFVINSHFNMIGMSRINAPHSYLQPL